MSLFGLFGPPNVEKLKAKKDVEGLIKALNYQKSGEVQSRAADALVVIGGDRAEKALLAGLRDVNLRLIVAQAWANGRGIAKTLLAALEEENEDIQKEVLRQYVKTLAEFPKSASSKGSFVQTLEKAADRIPTGELQTICNFNDVFELREAGVAPWCAGEKVYEREMVIDYSYIRQLARQELIRRGLKA